MRRWILALSVVVAAACGSGAEAVVDWSSTSPISGTVESGAVVVEGPGFFPLAMVDSLEFAPGQETLTLLVPIEFTDVGEGYLEMWVVFPDGGRYFSRTLGDSGGVAVIAGSGERTATLPFEFSGAPAPPVSLELNVVMAGPGRVSVGDVTLIDDFATEAAGTGGWWDGRTGGILGAVLGVVLGTVGAWLGRMASRGPTTRAQRLASAVSILSVAILVVGIGATVGGQPYEVFYPLLLGGGLGALIFGGLAVMLGRRIRDDELRQIRAADLAG